MPDIEVSVYDAWNHVSIRVRDENKLDKVLEIIKDQHSKIISLNLKIAKRNQSPQKVILICMFKFKNFNL
jgi:hypothetical protein